MNQIEVPNQPENSPAGSTPPAQAVLRRTLKIEDLGDPFRGNSISGIRLKGKWLASAGFRPGKRVAVTVVSTGRMELKSVEPAAQAEKNSADLKLSPQGTIWLFYALTDRAREWMDMHCPAGDDHQYFCGALVVESRYVRDLLQHADEDGLVISQ